MLELIDSNNIEELEQAIQEYFELIEVGICNPKLICYMPEQLGENNFLLLTRNNAQISGIMKFSTYSREELCKTLLLNDQSLIPVHQNINYIDLIESFKHGNGTKMLDWLKDRSDLIVLSPFPIVEQWYLKQDFQELQLNRSPFQTKYLYWKR